MIAPRKKERKEKKKEPLCIHIIKHFFPLVNLSCEFGSHVSAVESRRVEGRNLTSLTSSKHTW